MSEGLEDRLKTALAPLSGRLSVCRAEEVPAGVLSRRLGSSGLAMWCAADEPGADNLLTLGLSLARTMGVESAGTTWRARLMADPGMAYDLDYPCCVLMLRGMAGLTPGLRDIVPMRGRDAFEYFSGTEAVIIREMNGAQDISETVEYAEALRDSLLAEMGCEITVGVGGIGFSPARSWREAAQALRLGARYMPERGVYVWNALLTERIVDELPESRMVGYRLMFSQMAAGGLDGELQATALTLLRCSLNLSDTARRLYIHRSTLVYRLDKIQRITGLDLRSFDDAVTFRLLYTIHSGARNDPIQKEDHRE